MADMATTTQILLHVEKTTWCQTAGIVKDGWKQTK